MPKMHRVEKKKNPDHMAKTLKENVTEEELEENPTSYSCLMTNGMDINHIWRVDSGTTSHMCINKDLFKTINFKHKADIFMADGQKIPTTGIGYIFLQCTKQDETNHMVKLCDVLYVPQLYVEI